MKFMASQLILMCIGSLTGLDGLIARRQSKPELNWRAFCQKECGEKLTLC